MYFPIKSLTKKHSAKINSAQINFENFKNFFIYSKNQESIDYLVDILKLDNFTVNGNHIITSSKDIFFEFSKPISETDIINMLKSRTTNQIIIISIDPIKVGNIPQNCEIFTKDLKELFQLASDENISLPKSIEFKKSAKYSLKDILCILLCKSKSKTYLCLSLILLFYSLFTPYLTYYYICISILIILAIYSRFNKSFN